MNCTEAGKNECKWPRTEVANWKFMTLLPVAGLVLDSVIPVGSEYDPVHGLSDPDVV